MYGRLTAVNVLQEGEISADLFTFHEAVSQLQLMEEEVLDAHISLAEMGPLWTGHDHALLAMTNDVDYDQDGKITNRCNHCNIQKERLHGCRKCCTNISSIISHSSQNHRQAIGFENLSPSHYSSHTDFKVISLPCSFWILRHIPQININFALRTFPPKWKRFASKSHPCNIPVSRCKCELVPYLVSYFIMPLIVVQAIM
jgi:hypothetical protein